MQNSKLSTYPTPTNPTHPTPGNDFCTILKDGKNYICTPANNILHEKINSFDHYHVLLG